MMRRRSGAPAEVLSRHNDGPQLGPGKRIAATGSAFSVDQIVAARPSLGFVISGTSQQNITALAHHR
jgi:hypothetical protein